MIFTPEQQEAMAACLRSIHSNQLCPAALESHGITNANDILAPWLQPPDDSVALDHPRANGPLMLLRYSAGRYRYSQDVEEAGWGCTHWHPTEEAARIAWNKLCREAK